MYKATQVDLDRAVAIKVLDVADDDLKEEVRQQRLSVMQKRFEREARLASQMRDERAITIYDFGRSGDKLYMAMEYVDGPTLGTLVAMERAIDPQRTLRIIRQALKALGEAHRIGFLHRDIKPHNIMIFEHAGEKDRVKVLDFGLVKLIDEEEGAGSKSDLTADNVLVGTPRFMSPEQIRGEELGPASDIYSLGLVMFEMLTGRRAVEADTTMKIVARHLDPEPFKIPAGITLPSEVLRILRKCVAKSAGDRYPTAEAAIEDIDAVLAGDIGEPTRTELSVDDMELKPRGRKAVAVVATLLAVGVVAAFAVVAMQPPKADDSAAEATTDREGPAVAVEGSAVSERKPVETPEAPSTEPDGAPAGVAAQPVDSEPDPIGSRPEPEIERPPAPPDAPEAEADPTPEAPKVEPKKRRKKKGTAKSPLDDPHIHLYAKPDKDRPDSYRALE